MKRKKKGIFPFRYITKLKKTNVKQLNVFFIIIGFLSIFRIAIFFFYIAIEGQYLRPDSELYMKLANNIINNQVFSESIQPPFKLDFFRTPGFPFFLALLKYLDIGSPQWIAFWQELIYGFCLWFFYRYSISIFGKIISRISLLFLFLEPSGIAYPKLILSETLFLPFLIVSLLLIGYYLQKVKWHYLILSGFIMGIGTLIRPALLYFPILIFITLIAFDLHSKRRWLHASLFLLIMAITVSPWYVRNYQNSGKLFFSGQYHSMLAYWHVPFVWESAKGIPILEGQRTMLKRVHTIKEQYKKNNGHPLPEVEVYKVQEDIALKELVKYPTEYCLQWFYGFLKTSMGVNLTTVYQTLKFDSGRMDILHIQEVKFYKKIWKYLKSQDKLILFVLVLRVLIAFFALLGALAIIKRKDCFLWIIMLTNFYFILLPGPMGLPRFRFPVEVFWFIQAYLGFIWVCQVLPRCSITLKDQLETI